MAGTVAGEWWEYSRWVYIVGRTLRLNYGSAGEKAAVKVFLTAVLANRPWLATRMNIKANSGKGYVIADETDNSLAEMLAVVGRDLKKIPMTDAEKTLADTLIAATGDRRYGVKGNLI